MPRGNLNFLACVVQQFVIEAQSKVSNQSIGSLPSLSLKGLILITEYSQGWAAGGASLAKVAFKLVLFAFKALVKFAPLTPKIASKAVFNSAAVDIVTGGTRVGDPGGKIGKGILDGFNVFKTYCIASNKGSGSVEGKGVSVELVANASNCCNAVISCWRSSNCLSIISL